MPADIVVVGSINHDFTVLTKQHPAPGETVLGHGHYSGGGGKGANQAVAAARLGNSVAMVGRVGNDETGRTRLNQLEAEGVDIGAVTIDPESPTGLAVIVLDETGQNSIVVSPGANMNVSVPEIKANQALLKAAKVVLAQLEVPPEAVSAAASLTSGLFLLNPAPARVLPHGLLTSVDVLIPNKNELAQLVGFQVDGREHLEAAAQSIAGPRATVVTLGAEGCLVIEGKDVTHLDTPEVQVVDTTGAGDAFCGALADGLNRGLSLVKAAQWASRVGAVAVTRAGAQDAIPTRAETERAFPV